jgi:hypothetical protein
VPLLTSNDLKELFDQLLPNENKRPKWRSWEIPEWVRRLFFHTYRNELPFKVAKDGLSIVDDPYQMGKAFGYAYWFRKTTKNPLKSEMNQLCGKVLNQYAIQTKSILAHYLEKAAYKDALRFLEGFLEAAKEGLVDETTKSLKKIPMHYELYYFMLQNWEMVDMCETRTSLYDWLCKRLGSQTIPTHDAFLKMCDRFGIGNMNVGRPPKRRHE